MAWQLWMRCQAYKCRPSEMLQIDNKLIAYYLDRGIWFFGSYVTREVDQAGDNAVKGVKASANRQALMNGARQRTLAKLCGEDITDSKVGFRDPGGKKGKR